MEITEVRVFKVEGATSLKANATITIDGCFVVHGLKIIEGTKGVFVAMPSYKTDDGKFKDIAHPIKTETRNLISQAVLDKYNEEK